MRLKPNTPSVRIGSAKRGSKAIDSENVGPGPGGYDSDTNRLKPNSPNVKFNKAKKT